MNCPRGGQNKPAEVKKGGDWAYITFPNGVPTVQDIKTNVGPVSLKEVVPIRPVTSPTTAAMLVPGKSVTIFSLHVYGYKYTLVKKKYVARAIDSYLVFFNMFVCHSPRLNMCV